MLRKHCVFRVYTICKGCFVCVISLLPGIFSYSKVYYSSLSADFTILFYKQLPFKEQSFFVLQSQVALVCAGGLFIFCCAFFIICVIFSLQHQLIFTVFLLNNLCILLDGGFVHEFNEYSPNLFFTILLYDGLCHMMFLFLLFFLCTLCCVSVTENSLPFRTVS